MILLQALEDLTLPNGIKVRSGQIFPAPEDVATALIKDGKARLRTPPGSREIKSLYPPIQGTWWREPTQPWPDRQFIPGAYEDRDNFIRNLVTVGYGLWWPGGAGDTVGEAVPPVTPTLSAVGREPVLTLAQI